MEREHAEGFAAFVRANHVALLKAARAVCFDPQTAEDVLQEALADVYGRWHKLDHSSQALMAYVIRVMYSKHASLRRRFWRKWNSELPLETIESRPSDDDWGRNEQSIVVMAAMRELTPVQRSIVGLRYYAGLSLKEIAETLDIPIGTVGSHLSRGHARLAPLLQTMKTPEQEGRTTQ